MVHNDWPEQNVLPIVVHGDLDEREPIRVAGTGFVLGHGLFVTCWHCVEAPLPEGCQYVAAPVDSTTGRHFVVPLFRLGRDMNGADIALAVIANHSPGVPLLRIAPEPADQGQPVWAYGYPLTEYRRDESNRTITRVAGRLLKGYVTMGTVLDEPGREGMRAYELDMPAPRGLSGAPVMIDAYNQGTPDVVGVVQGVREVYQVEDEAHLDPDSGEAIPERVRIVTFTVALHTDTLHQARGQATGGRTVEEFLGMSDRPA